MERDDTSRESYERRTALRHSQLQSLGWNSSAKLSFSFRQTATVRSHCLHTDATLVLWEHKESFKLHSLDSNAPVMLFFPNKTRLLCAYCVYDYPIYMYPVISSIYPVELNMPAAVQPELEVSRQAVTAGTCSLICACHR